MQGYLSTIVDDITYRVICTQGTDSLDGIIDNPKYMQMDSTSYRVTDSLDGIIDNPKYMQMDSTSLGTPISYAVDNSKYSRLTTI